MLTHLKIRFMKNSLLILVLGWIFFSCTEQRKESANKVVNIHLEPSMEKANKLSEIIDSIFIIPLETCEEALLATISKLECDDNLYFVQNSRDNLVYVFDSNGKFVRQIAKKGNGPGEILYPQCFALDKRRKEVWLTNNDAFYFYDYEGRYKGARKYSLAFSDFCIEKNNNVYFYTAKNNNSHVGDGFLTGDITLLTEDNKKKTWFVSESALHRQPNQPIDSYYSNLPFCEQKDGQITTHYAFSDTLYSIDKKMLYPKYVIDFGENKSDVNLNELSASEAKKYIESRPYTPWFINNVMETSSFLLFTYNIGFQMQSTVFYNKKNTHIKEGRLINDLLDGHIWRLGVRGNRFVGYIAAYDKQIQKKLSEFVDKTKLSTLENLEGDSNPILIEFTLRDF